MCDVIKLVIIPYKAILSCVMSSSLWLYHIRQYYRVWCHKTVKSLHSRSRSSREECRETNLLLHLTPRSSPRTLLIVWKRKRYSKWNLESVTHRILWRIDIMCSEKCEIWDNRSARSWINLSHWDKTHCG